MIENQNDLERVQSETRALELRVLRTRSELVYETVLQHITRRRDAICLPPRLFRAVPILPSHRQSLRERGNCNRTLRYVRRRFHAHRRNLQLSQRPAVDTRNWYQDLYDRLEQAKLLGPLQDLGRDTLC